MGNSNGRQSGSSSPRKDAAASAQRPARTFDGGSLSPHGIYPGTADYNPTHVLKFIRERRLAPFYKGLDDYEDEWTDYQLAYMVKEGKLPPTADSPFPASSNSKGPSNSSTPSLQLPPSIDELNETSTRTRGKSFAESSQQTCTSSTSVTTSNKDVRMRPRAQTIGSSTLVPTRGKPLEVVVYRNAIECPVCFLVNCHIFHANHSIIRPTLIARDAAGNQFVQNASSR